MTGFCFVVGTFAPTVIESISEDNATLPCQHKLGPLGNNLDIEWLSNDSDHGQKVILSYSGGQVYENRELKGRYSFVADFLAGDATIFIRSLEPNDAGLYTCKVKNAGQYAWSHVILKILVKPSEPDCWIEGEQIVGRNVTLNCKSSVGSLPMKYYWQHLKHQEYSGYLPTRPARGPGIGSCAGQAPLPLLSLMKTAEDRTEEGRLPPTVWSWCRTEALQHTRSPQQLFLQNVSKADNGSYRCIVSNQAGSRICYVHLTAQTPTNVAFLAGITCGSIGGVLFLVLLCWYLFRKKELKKREEDEFLNEIREDAEAPKARLMKPGSSSSGSRSSRSGSSSTRSTTNSASRSQRTLSTQEAPHGDSRHHCLEQI
ncbi:CXADR-like membrane protein isoform X2 [Dendrobates tinctorius]|uniref:CXADR-like membrane protein isoform X2 n=1 Tax=Dendrobates tinctorius TaxID=92724 RepID=UPI003CC99062